MKSFPVLSIFRLKDWNMFVTLWETVKTAWLFSEQKSCKLLVFAFQGVHYHKATLLFYVTLTFICHWGQVSHTNNLILLPSSIYHWITTYHFLMLPWQNGRWMLQRLYYQINFIWNKDKKHITESIFNYVKTTGECDLNLLKSLLKNTFRWQNISQLSL